MDEAVDGAVMDDAVDGEVEADTESSEDSGFRLPEIEFTTGDEAEIEEWEQEREEAYIEIEESWEAAVRDVVNAIQQPVNDFIDAAGLLEMESAYLNLETEQDIAEFIADNVVVDGSRLSDMFGESITKFFDDENAWLDENAWWVFDYSNYHIPPMMKKKSLAKRKMQAEKRLGKALKVPMVTKKTKGGGKKGQWDDADSVVAAFEVAEEQDEGEKCDTIDVCDELVCWTEEMCWY